MKKIVFCTFLSVVVSTVFVGCTEEVDESARYVFKDVTIIDYLNKYQETYSEYLEILRQTNVSEVSQSSLYSLLSARGHYTVFAPTNEAVYDYLQTLVETHVIDRPSWDAFTSDKDLDSIRRVIAYNSIIDSKEQAAYYIADFPPANNSELPLANMNDRKISGRGVENQPDSFYVNFDCPVSIKNRDIPAINGLIHQVEKVICPNSISMKELLYRILDKKKEGFYVAARMLIACGLEDTLDVCEDEVYRDRYVKGLVPDFDGAAFGWVFHGATGWPTAYAPEHRKIGFTVFAERDDFWRKAIGKDPFDITPADVQQWVLDNHQYSDEDQFVTDENYASEKNLLYQWLTYHVLPMRISSDRLVFHENEKGYNKSSKEPTIPVYEFYATMGQRRLLKIFESKESNGVYLNRFPKLDNGRRATYHELYCDPDKRGCLIDNQSAEVLEYEAQNGIIYGIDAPLSYNDETRDNLHHQRIRFDSMSMFPEAMTNDIRKKHSEDYRDQYVHFPPNSVYQYLEGMDMNNETHFVYLNAYKYEWGNLQEDELKAEGHYEVTVKLPPVPRRGMYEVRYRVIPNGDRGIAQFYFGTDKTRLVPTGIPVDLTAVSTDPDYGYAPDTEDDDYNAEIDKRMRNKGRMKAEESVGANGCRTSDCIRHIVTRQILDPKETYYLRLKSVLDSDKKEFFMDYLEYCPKEIYDNPSEPEDIW